MNKILNKDQMPDYFVAQFPGGGQRGYATVNLLEWFERETGLPTHQLFPYVTSGSVGILIASALYLPHPEHPKAARMSARQLAEIFPRIAERTPKPARFNNTNSRIPFSEAIEPYIGHGKLKDFLGTVFFSCHKIGFLSQSYLVQGKRICPTTGEASYIGDPDERILDIAFAGISLPSLFQAYREKIDLAFAEVPSKTMVEIAHLFPPSAKGAFVRVGNFRGKEESSRKYLEKSGYLFQAASFAITDAVSDHTYSQTIDFAQTFYRGNVFNLEHEIDSNYESPPQIRADIVTEEQFRKIKKMSDKFILDNEIMLKSLAAALKESALQRMRLYPETAFGIPPIVQEFPIYQLPPLPKKNERTSRAFELAAGTITKAINSLTAHSLQTAFEVANSETAQYLLKTAGEYLTHADKILLPRSHKKTAYAITEEASSALPPSVTDRKP